MSANEGQVEVQAPPRRRVWLRLLGAVLLFLLLVLACGEAYRRFARPAPAPPEVDLAGVDPAVVKAVEQAQQGVRQEPQSALAWGRLGMILVVHEFHTPGIFCLEQAERLDPGNSLWPYAQALVHVTVGNHEAALPKL